MKKMLICILLFSFIGGKCFAQALPNHMTPNYMNGIVSAQNGAWEEAFKYFKDEADKGNEAAQYQTAMCYAQGEGVAVNFQEAFNYMYKAATSKTPFEYAYEKLGYYYSEGLGCSKNYDEAMKWYQKGIATKNKSLTAICTYQIGTMFLDGHGVKQDYQKAVSLFKFAAELDYPSAAHNLGYMYDNGEGIMKDEIEAVKWYQKAAELGLASSQYNLGVLYLDGRKNVPADKSKALLWLKKAAAQGHTKALIVIAELEEK